MPPAERLHAPPPTLILFLQYVFMTSDRMYVYNENASKNWLLKNYVRTLKDYWIRGVVYGALFQYEISSSVKINLRGASTNNSIISSSGFNTLY
jgi:hypothetical protein